jgi:threonine aldolase
VIDAPRPGPLHDPTRRSFASDNASGIHPEVLAAIIAANGGHQGSYGSDVYTERLQETFQSHFGPTARAYPVFNGTGANVVALQAMTDRWGAVICTDTAHIHVDECGAPERMGGLKLLPIPTPDGKITPALIDREARGFDDEHRARPQVVSITQTTELGTAYTVEEIIAICTHAHGLGLRVHVDGARLANAAATLGVPLAAFTTDVGVDVVSFGGTKNGLMLGEVVVVLDPEIGAGLGLAYVRKMSMQLASKMRFISAQFDALLSDDLWLRNASHANAMARRLAAGVRDLPGLEISRQVEANAVFAVLPSGVTARLQEEFSFLVWNEGTGEVRWMCSFDTTEADVDAFVEAIKKALGTERQ